MWDLSKGIESWRAEATATAMVVMPNGREVALGRYNDALVVDLWGDNGDPKSLTGHTDSISALAASQALEGVLVTASWDNTAKIWDLGHVADPILAENGKVLQGELPYDAAVDSMAFLPDGHRVLVAHGEKLTIREIKSRANLRTWRAHEYRVNAVAVTPDGRRAISASNDKTLKVWDLESGTELLTLRGHKDFVTDVAITPDGKRAVSCSGKAILLRDNTLKIWDLESGMPTKTLFGHSREVHAVAVTPNGDQVLSASGDGTLIISELKTNDQRKMVPSFNLEHRAGGLDAAHLPDYVTVTSVAVTLDGRYVVSGSSEGRITLWEFDSGQEVHTWEAHSAWIHQMRAFPDGQTVISASADSTVKVWDLQTRRMICSFAGDSAMCSCVVAPDGLTILAGEKSGRLHTLKFENL
jgi:WD40 repeat protein